MIYWLEANKLKSGDLIYDLTHQQSKVKDVFQISKSVLNIDLDSGYILVCNNHLFCVERN